MQAAYVPWPDGRSSRHWKPTPGSVELNVNVAEFTAIVPVGPESMLVSGGWSNSYAPESQPFPCGRARSR